MQTYTQFIEKYGLSLACARLPGGSYTYRPGNFALYEDVWDCRITRQADDGPRYMDLKFRMGSGHGGKEPTLEQVLYCLASDAHAIQEYPDILEFVHAYGYDIDTKEDRDKATAAYEGCKEQTEDLRRLLGDEGLEELLYETNEEGE